MALTPGTRLGVYEITTQIGEGGMGQVYRGTHTTLGRQVAIKILPDALAADHARVARFEREAKTLALLNHPHIAAIYGRHVAFTGSPAGEGGPQIWVRSLDTLQARSVARWSLNPEPFWSADSRFIAFQKGGKLKKVDIAGCPRISLADAPVDYAGGAWNHDDVIVSGDRGGGWKQVSGGGGVPAPLTTLDEKRQELNWTAVLKP